MRHLVYALLASLFFATTGEADDLEWFNMTAWTPSLKGSPESLIRQNIRADLEGLARIANDRELGQLERQGHLIEIRETFYLREKPDPQWPERFRWLRPNAATCLDDLAAVFYKMFGVPLQVNSGVRTKDRQRVIGRTNYSAAPSEGVMASAHLTGSAFDIAKLPLSAEQLEFLRVYLLDLEESGFIEVTEEFYQAVFHVMVFSTYPARDLDTPLSGMTVASAPQ